MSKWRALIMWNMLALSAAACAANTATPTPDQVATEVAVARAVAATLTAGAPTAVPLMAPTVAPADTALPAATATQEPTAEAQPTATATLRPTVPAPRPPTATNTPQPEAADPFVPGVGNPKGLIGKIVLPGYSGPLNPPVFKDHIVFKLVVFDPAIGHEDGAGIRAVNIEAVDPQGNTIFKQHEGSWAYCAFGNASASPTCDVWRFKEHDFKWPNGTPVCAGSGYSANMVVETDDPAKNEANWNFKFAVESPDGSLPACS